MAHNKFQEGGWSGIAYGMNSVERDDLHYKSYRFFIQNGSRNFIPTYNNQKVKF
jgi:hypothetical protein